MNASLEREARHHEEREASLLSKGEIPMSTASNPKVVEDTLETVAYGLAHHLPPGTKTIKVDGKAVRVVELIKDLNGYHAKYVAAREAEAKCHGLVSARDKIRGEAMAAIKAVKKFVFYEHDDTSDDVKKFGFEPRKTPRQLTAEEKADKAKKSRATREKKKNGKPPAP